MHKSDKDTDRRPYTTSTAGVTVEPSVRLMETPSVEPIAILLFKKQMGLL